MNLQVSHRRFLTMLLPALGIPLLAATGGRGPLAQEAGRRAVESLGRHQALMTDVATALWEHPEVAHQEVESSRRLSDELERAGFRVDRGVAHLPTAFVASYGSGSPVIGIVALLDALPGLSQESLVAERRPIVEGAPGQACGHHLIAAADLGAALALKDLIDAHVLKGTVKLFGAPAEEIYHGGVFMVRDGVFDGLDALLFWHPSSVTGAISQSGLAMRSIKFVFAGRPSDATDARAAGRDALTALEAFNHSVHQAQAGFAKHVVVNHVVTSGGQIPSIVPERAEAWYFVHAQDLPAVDEVVRTLSDLAARSARDTGTTLDVRSLSGSHDWLINKSLASLIHATLTSTRDPELTNQEVSLARAQQASFDNKADQPVFTGVLPLNFAGDPVHISDDTAEASWIVPRGGFLVACYPAGIASHTWQWTAMGRSSFAYKGMMKAATTILSVAVRLMTDATALADARNEFKAQTAGLVYRSPIPAGQEAFTFFTPGGGKN